MTSVLGMHNIPLDMHNISPTYTTSPWGDLRRRDVVDVVHVVPKKNVPATYLLSVIDKGWISLRRVRGTHASGYPRTYPRHNMHNISNTCEATSLSAAYGQPTDLATHRLARAHQTRPTDRKDQP